MDNEEQSDIELDKLADELVQAALNGNPDFPRPIAALRARQPTLKILDRELVIVAKVGQRV